MDPGLYDFAKFKAQTSYFKGVATEDAKRPSSGNHEYRQFKSYSWRAGRSTLLSGHVVGAIGVSGAKPEITKPLQLKESKTSRS